MSDTPNEAGVRVIVVGIDGSDHSRRALRLAIERSRIFDAALHVAYVHDSVTPAVIHLPGNQTMSTTDLADAKRREVWDAVAGELTGAPEAIRTDLEGYPAEALVERCSSVNADLLVLGTRSRGRLASATLGSTALAAIHHSPCNVLIAKH